MNQPEILLVAILVLATIRCFPLEGPIPSAQDENHFLMPTFNWKDWQEVMAPSLTPEPVTSTANYLNVTASQITSMEPGDLDEYFAQLSLLTDAQCESSKAPSGELNS